MDEIAQIVREVYDPTNNINEAVLYHGLVSVVKTYNNIARRKQLPTKKIPPYNRHMNRDLLKRLKLNILRDNDTIRNISEKRDVLTGVTFADDTFTDGIWTYTIIEDTTDNVSAVLNKDAFTNAFGEPTAITLGYEHMPYERLIDIEGNEYITVSYENMLTPLPDTVTSLTIDDWTNCNVTIMNGVFSRCSSLESLTLGANFDTTNVEDMQMMFNQCRALKSLDLCANFDTANVTTMNAMFKACSALKSLTLGAKFDTSKVEDMDSMFYSCSSLESLTLGANFNTANVTVMRSMFTDCESLESLTLGESFNTANVTEMPNMFEGCIKLKSLRLGVNFNTAKVRHMPKMFADCDNLASVSLYAASDSIIKMLPAATWKINDSEDTVTTQGRTDHAAKWKAGGPPGDWATVPLTLTRTIQT